MKKYCRNVSILSLLLICSCASVLEMPISEVVPAAEIKVKSKSDNNGNTILEITAENLAAPSRLKPSANVYSVWVETEKASRTENIGMLNTDGGKVSLEVVTPYKPKSIFITAEKEGNLTYPNGTLITKANLK
ncbi:hypothetical protein [Maribacter aurantiacus]|uniref:Uncharacterized protein n=1 Tax=Maribacter aurantiacus TaxID=1882343 RepID=A0A5R8M3Z1_9FLAO|nr:hypothetical protein [Maribacter aurantiacus]TLF44304.1 hypothetical protein FEK29_12795 [Maribacter aurantiacus]